MGATTGSLAWVRETGGRMGPRDILGQLGAGVALQMRILPAQILSRFGLWRPKRVDLDPREIKAPDSRAAREAEALCREASLPFLLNHSLRCYLWGRLLASANGHKLDEELFYVACLLHDLGLTEKYGHPEPDVHCFTLLSAGPARNLAGKEGWVRERQDALVEAITLHLNVSVGLEHGVEAHLLNASTALDVTGLRLWELPRERVNEVHAIHPRLGLKTKIGERWSYETELRPDSRARFLSRYLQFNGRIKAAPFDE